MIHHKTRDLPILHDIAHLSIQQSHSTIFWNTAVPKKSFRDNFFTFANNALVAAPCVITRRLLSLNFVFDAKSSKKAFVRSKRWGILSASFGGSYFSGL